MHLWAAAIKYDMNNGSNIATRNEVAEHCISLKTAGDGNFGAGSNNNFCLAQSANCPDLHLLESIVF